jgi:serine/threonine protein kinase
MVLIAGTRLGPYKVVALIGAGGMGKVYRARDTTLNRDVAVKGPPQIIVIQIGSKNSRGSCRGRSG